MSKYLLVNYYNTDVKKEMLGMFEKDDFRLTDKRFSHNYQNVIGEISKTKVKAIPPDYRYPATVGICNGKEYYIFSDHSVIAK